MTFAQELQAAVTAVQKRDPRLDDDAATARALNDNPALYAKYRQHQWPMPAAPETREITVSSPAADEALRRAEGLVAKSHDLGLRDALSKVFRADPDLYRHYVASHAEAPAADETPPPTPVVKVVEHPLAGDLLALAKLFHPDDPTGAGMVKVRRALELLHETVARKQRSA